jgi:preprotein translocase subunit YajC
LTLLQNEIFAYNFIMLATFPLAGLAMYLLAVYLTRNKWASFIAGLAYAFCPYHFAHASHITLANIQWMPLFILFLFKLHKERTYPNAVLCGLFFALTLLSDTYYGYFMLVSAATFFIFMLVRKFFRKIKKLHEINFTPQVGIMKNISLLCVSVFTAAVVCFPYIFPILDSYLSANGKLAVLKSYERNIKELKEPSATLLNYILPSPNHPLLGGFTYRLEGSLFYGENPQEYNLFLGLFVIIMSVYAFRLWRNSKKNEVAKRDIKEAEEIDFSIKFFVSLAVVAFLFSLYPVFILFGKELWLPSAYIYDIVPFFRSIGRFGIVLMLALSVLMAFGIKFLFERISLKKTRMALALLFSVIVIFEFVNFPPFKATDIAVKEEVYFWLKDEPSDILIVEYPIEEDDTVTYLFNQRMHQKKIVNGAPKGTEAYSTNEKIRDILEPRTKVILNRLGVTYVVVHFSKYTQLSEKEDVKIKLLQDPESYGLREVKDFNETKVYRIIK